MPRLARALLAFVRRRPERAKMHFTIAVELFLTNFRKPVKRSAYYGQEIAGRASSELIMPHKEKAAASLSPLLLENPSSDV